MGTKMVAILVLGSCLAGLLTVINFAMLLSIRADVKRAKQIVRYALAAAASLQARRKPVK